MKAIVQHEYGPPDVLKIDEIDRPVVKDNEVLVRIHAASVHAGDWHIVRGEPYLIRLMGFGLRKPKFSVPGNDMAGLVETVGKDVTRFQPGDEVFGTCNGAFAEYVSASEDDLALKPANLTFEQAATVPISGFTALQALRDHGKTQPGQKVLIIGASGGVGTFAVQIAKSFGAEVTGVCSTRNLEMVLSIGADHVIDYTQEDFVQGGPRFDLIIDTVANRSLADRRRALMPNGTLVLVGGSGGRWLAGLERTLGAALLSLFVSQKFLVFFSTGNKEDLATLKDLLEAEKVTPVIDREYPLAETPDAIRYIETGHTQGKIVINVRRSDRRRGDVQPQPD